jgi:hypothetical protein
LAVQYVSGSKTPRLGTLRFLAQRIMASGGRVSTNEVAASPVLVS